MDLVDHLKILPLFKGLKPEQLELLVSQFKSRRYLAGEPLVAQGDLGNRFFVLENGVVNLRVTDANGVEHSHGVLPAAPVPGSALPPKNYFGEQMFEMQQPFEFQAYAVTDVDAYILDRGDLDAALIMHRHLVHAMPFIEEAEHKRTHGLKWVESGEVVTAVFHKHWWALVPALAQTASIAIAVLVISFAIGFFGFSFGNIVLAIGAALVLILFALQFYDWHNDEYIMTTQRVAHVERQFISIELTEAVPFDKIIGSKVERNGIAGIIGVSDVVIQTAGRQEGSVSFAHVGNGPQIVKMIEQQRGRVRGLRAADQRERERERVQQKLREYILPHVVARERAEAAARVPPPPPPPPPSTWRRAQNFIHSMFELEMKKDTVVTWRKHWIVLLRQEYKIVLGLFGLDAIFVFLAINPGLQVLPFGGYLLAGLTLLGIGLFGVWWQWEDWRNDTYAVTMTQVIDAERLPLGIREKSITAQLDQVQDVRVEVEGILPTLLHYGNLKIETAGQGSQMVFKNIYHPREASEEIFRHIEDLRKRILERETDLRDRVTIDSLIGYDRIRKEEERHNRNNGGDSNKSDDDDDDDADDES
jgi:hypothetical protein